MGDQELILYTTHCPKCKVIEEKLKAKNVNFNIVDNVEELTKLGFTSFPMLKVGDQILDFINANKYVNSL